MRLTATIPVRRSRGVVCASAKPSGRECAAREEALASADLWRAARYPFFFVFFFLFAS